MTEDAILRDFLLDAAAAEFAAELNDTMPVDASPRLRRQMNAMLSDPNGWAKRRHRPVWKRIARAAAMILLTVTLSLGALMAVSPTVRAAVINWAMEWYETHIIYRFSGKQEEDPFAPLPRYEITALPEGYVFYQEIDTLNAHDTGYVNTGGELLWFGYQRMTQGGLLAIDGVDKSTISEIQVNGMRGQFHLSTDPIEPNLLVWIDEGENMMLSIQGFLGEQELLHIAESADLFNVTN